MKICLYEPVSPSDEYAPILRPPVARLKSWVNNTLDLWRSAAAPRIHLTHYHYMQRSNTNRGDIALGRAIKEQIAAAAGFDIEFMELSWGSLADNISAINETCDLFVIAGGGYIFLDTRGELGWQLRETELLKKLKCPVVAYAIGLNQLMDQAVFEVGRDRLPQHSSERLRLFLDTCRAVSVRDDNTRKLLDLASGRDVVVTGDPALFLSHSTPPSTGAPRDAGPTTVGLNLAAHGPIAVAILNKIFPVVLDFLKTLQAQAGVRFVYFVHDDAERAVVRKLQREGVRLFEVIDSDDPRDLVARYKTVDLVICQMLHSCILSFNASVPVLNMSYDRKNQSFFDLFDLARCTVPVAGIDLSTLVTRFGEIRGDLDGIRATIEAGKVRLRNAQAGFLHSILELAAASHRPG